MLGAIAGGLASGIASSALSDGGGGSGAYEMSELEKNIQGQISDMLGEGMPEYEGDLTVDQSEYESTLADQAISQLNNAGMSEGEMNSMWQKAKDTLNDQRDEGVQNTIRSMNSRGILSSDITSNALRDVSDQYSENAANALRDINLQNQQVKRQQQQNAMNTLYNLAGMQQQRQTGNISRQMNQFYQQQQLNQMPLQMGMNYLTGVQIPRQTGKAQAQAQSSAGKWGAFGNLAGIAGSVLLNK